MEEEEEEEEEGTDGLGGTPKAASNPIAVRERSVDIDVSDHLPSSEDSIDYDALYEEADNDEEDVDMKSHGSVITHLLSQVRIGLYFIYTLSLSLSLSLTISENFETRPNQIRA